MRVSFVHPAGYNFCPGQSDFTILANRMAPIGILTLAAWLDKHGHETQLVDCLGPNPPKSIEATVEKVLAFNPDARLVAQLHSFAGKGDVFFERKRRAIDHGT